jgi:hypothetical protein
MALKRKKPLKRSSIKRSKKALKKTPLRKKAKAKTLGWYKNQFWTVFSQFVRIRDKGQCFTCPTKKHWKKMQAGHMVPRAAGGLALYFHEQNVHCQCYRCNINLGGNGAVYAKNFVDKYGQEQFDLIMKLKDQGCTKYAIADYQRMTEQYKGMVDELLIKRKEKPLYS